MGFNIGTHHSIITHQVHPTVEKVNDWIVVWTIQCMDRDWQVTRCALRYLLRLILNSQLIGSWAPVCWSHVSESQTELVRELVMFDCPRQQWLCPSMCVLLKANRTSGHWSSKVWLGHLSRSFVFTGSFVLWDHNCSWANSLVSPCIWLR